MTYTTPSPLRRGLSAVAAVTALLAPATALAQATLVTGLGGAVDFGSNVLTPNDDGSSAPIPLAPYNLAGLCFFGRTHTQVYINNNGNVTFDGATPTYTPAAFPASANPMMAPWWADVDTRGAGPSIPNENRVYWDIRAGRLVVTWYRVGYYNAHVDLRNTFQLVIRQVAGTMDYDVEYRYNQLTWTTGDASGGMGGLGGVPAQAGFDAGNMLNFSTLPGSRTASILNLLTTSNVTPAQAGVWTYRFRGCALQCATNADCGGPTPICDATARTCRACASNTDCGGSTPVCATTGASAGRCVQCVANTQCATGMCAANACVCATNADCRGSTPICDTRTRACRACDAASASDCTGMTPVCGPAGVCVQCSPGITSACRAPTPRCDGATLTCVACLANADCSGSTPYCSTRRCVAGAVMFRSPTAGTTTAGRTPPITGTATPGQTVTITVGGQTLTTTADPVTGEWSVTPPMPLPVGSNTATATLPTAGGMTPSAVVTFNVPCASASECAAPTPICDTATRLCRGCASNADCGAATPVCASGTCVLCTAAMPAACASNADGRACLTATTGAALFCGCATDADCGSATSGRVCDATTRRCVAGCSASPTRNHCPAGQFCTSSDATGATVGTCTTTCNFDSDCATSMPTRPRCLVAGDAGVMNTCVECVSDAQCASRTDGRTRCIGPMNTCAQCSPSAPAACAMNASGTACLGTGLCGCTRDADCAATQMCATATSTCVTRSTPDASVDVPADVAADVTVDVTVDVTADVTADVATDIASDIATDIAADVTTDVVIDASVDGSVTPDVTTSDVAADIVTRPDVIADASDDAGKDAGDDAAVDAAAPDVTTPDFTITGDGACACSTPGTRPGSARDGIALASLALAFAALRRRVDRRARDRRAH